MKAYIIIVNYPTAVKEKKLPFQRHPTVELKLLFLL